MNGLLGKSLSTNGDYVKVYEAPAVGIDFVTINVSIVNTSAGVALVDTAVSSTGAPTVVDHIGWQDEVGADGGTLEFSCHLLSPGEALYVRGNTDELAIRVYGLEKEAPIQP